MLFATYIDAIGYILRFLGGNYGNRRKNRAQPRHPKDGERWQAIARLGKFAKDTPLIGIDHFWLLDYKGNKTIGNWFWDCPENWGYGLGEEDMQKWAEGKLFEERQLNDFNHFSTRLGKTGEMKLTRAMTVSTRHIR